jgi:hypothetical protein
MATWSANVTATNKQITIPLSVIQYQKNLEFLITGSLNGCVVSLYRQVFDPIAGGLTTPVSMNISWSDQTQLATITQALAGLVAELKHEGNLVIRFTGSVPSIHFLIIGTGEHKDITNLVVDI